MTEPRIAVEELILRTRSGCRHSFEELIRRHQNLVHGLAYHRLGNFEDAEDAAQATFIRAFARLQELRRPQAFTGWLRTIAENECHQILRDRRELAPLAETPAPQPDIDGRLDMERALAALPEKDRLVLTLFCFENRSQREIARFLGVSVDSVMSRLRHARARLRKDMNETRIKEHLLPPDWATKIPIPYDEYDWHALPEPPPSPLSEWRRGWLLSLYPEGSELLSAQRTGYEWEREAARSSRFEVRLPTGEQRQVEIRTSGRRGGIELDAKLLPLLASLGIQTARLVGGPTPDPALPNWEPVITVEPLAGISATRWCLDQDFQGYQRACEAVLDGIDVLASVTAEVRKAIPEIETCRLVDELNRTGEIGGPWLTHPEFKDALNRIRPVVEQIEAEPIFSDSGAGPNVIVDESGSFVGFEDLAWARIEDPHYGATKYWTYDCYPLRWVGFVERYLVHHGLTMRDFAPRLAVRALATLQREIPLEGNDQYRDDMLGWLRMAMRHLD